jgi:hypothetical protein
MKHDLTFRAGPFEQVEEQVDASTNRRRKLRVPQLLPPPEQARRATCSRAPSERFDPDETCLESSNRILDRTGRGDRTLDVGMHGTEIADGQTSKGGRIRALRNENGFTKPL